MKAVISLWTADMLAILLVDLFNCLTRKTFIIIIFLTLVTSTVY